jgi:hypothetical protein
VSTIEVAQGHRLDEVVDVGGGEGEVDTAVALDRALPLEVADPTAEQHYLTDRQQRRGRRLARLLRLLALLGGGSPGLEQEEPGSEHRHDDQRREQIRTTHDSLLFLQQNCHTRRCAPTLA